ncbi:MAG: PAS domain-containing sensor histidine kinase [Chloroflexi bacterium]|nr:PAS domain-containing sensor histidine kinase [Chloroflexota bacterium]
MDTPTPQSTPGDRAQQLRGLMRVVNDLGSATDNLFKRIYGSLSRQRKTMIDTEAMRRTQAHARALQRRTRAQSIEIARLTGVLATIEEGVVMQDVQGRIVLMNEPARQLIGGVRVFWDSPLGRMFTEYSAPSIDDDAPTGPVEPLGEPERVEVGDKLLGVRMARVFSDHGQFLGTVMVLTDVTGHSLTERLKTSFIPQMAHELRTPLTSIKGMSDVLLNLPEGRPPNRGFLEAISRNVAILDRMTIELLDLSEIDAETFEVRLEPVHLAEQVFIVLQGMEPRLRKAKLTVTVMVIGAPAIQGDARRLQWALGHLIENAVQYTLPDGDITVQVGRVRRGYIELKIIDTGVGISDKDLPHIFERYYRGEARTPEGKVLDPRGLGQGLYIAKAVVEAHGGSISVASVVGDGTTFTLAFPVREDLP